MARLLAAVFGCSLLLSCGSDEGDRSGVVDARESIESTFGLDDKGRATSSVRATARMAERLTECLTEQGFDLSVDMVAPLRDSASDMEDLSPEQFANELGFAITTTLDLSDPSSLSVSSDPILTYRLSLPDAERVAFDEALFGASYVDVASGLVQPSGDTCLQAATSESEDLVQFSSALAEVDAAVKRDQGWLMAEGDYVRCMSEAGYDVVAFSSARVDVSQQLAAIFATATLRLETGDSVPLASPTAIEAISQGVGEIDLDLTSLGALQGFERSIATQSLSCGASVRATTDGLVDEYISESLTKDDRLLLLSES